MAEITGSLPEALASLQFALIADAVWLEVAKLMADMAQRHAVGHIVGKLRKVLHRLLVVSAQIPAAIITAVSAPVAIALKYGLAPDEVFRLPSQTKIARRRAALPSVMITSSRRGFSRSLRHQGALFHGEFPTAQFRWPSLFCGTHQRLCRFGVRAPFEPRLFSGSPKMISAWIWRAAALKARLVDPVVARSILAKFRETFPQHAAVASMQPGRDSRKVVGDFNTSSPSGKLQTAGRSSSHG